MVVVVEVIQTSGTSCSYQTSRAPWQRRAFLLQEGKRNKPRTTCLSPAPRHHVPWWKPVNRWTPCYFTIQASRSRTEPLSIKTYTRHGYCPSQEKPTMSTKFGCFKLWGWRMPTLKNKTIIISPSPLMCSKPISTPQIVIRLRLESNDGPLNLHYVN